LESVVQILHAYYTFLSMLYTTVFIQLAPTKNSQRLRKNVRKPQGVDFLTHTVLTHIGKGTSDKGDTALSQGC